MTLLEKGADKLESHDSHMIATGPHTCDELVGTEEDFRVQAQAQGHDSEDPQAELLAAQEKGGLDLLEVAQRT